MKRFFMTMVCVCSSLIGLQAAPVKAQLIQYPVYAPQTVENYRAVCIQNDLNRYVIKLVETKPQGENPGKFQIRLREPSPFFNFSRPINDFLQIKVGSLPLHKLSPNLDAISFWNREKESGFTLPLNFNGKKYSLSFSMREDSPVLWARFTAPKDFSEQMEITLQAVPSALIVGQWIGYSRFAKTARKEIRGAGKFPLNAEDLYVILSDDDLAVGKKLDKKGTAVGPCLIVWKSDDTSASVEGLNQYIVKFLLQAQKQIEFGIWESKRKFTDAEFNNYFETWKKTVVSSSD